MYYNARFYDPSIGRFLTPDAIVPNPTDAQHFNRYAYVTNNPIKYTDPTGHEPDEGSDDWDDYSNAESNWGGSSGGGHDGQSDDDRSKDQNEMSFSDRIKELFKPLTPTYSQIYNHLNMNGYKISNPHVLSNLHDLVKELISILGDDADFSITVTGGDRYMDEMGNIRSSTTGEIVCDSEGKPTLPSSPHLDSFGARAVDIRGLGRSGIPKDAFDQAIKNTNFDTGPNYSDNHIHLELPNYRRFGGMW